MEDSSTAMNSIITTAYAATNETLSAYIKGNYNGLMATSKTTGGNVCILALPSIILQDVSSASGTILNSGDSLQKNNLILHKKTNLPSSYTTNTITTASGTQFIYTPLQNGNQTTVGSGITAYCSGNLPSSTGAIAALASNLKTIYGSSGLSTDTSSASQVSSFVASTKQDSVIANVVNASLGGVKVDVGNSSGKVETIVVNGFIQIAPSSTHTCAITTSGGVKCWGKNDKGQLGNGTTTSSYTPVQVSGITSGATSISVNNGNTCAIVNSVAKCWGQNDNGQLGDGTTTNRQTPVDVLGMNSAASLKAGYQLVCGLTTS